ncbi:hypothetical protein ZEAMMB73_Zm00001d009920 [Zea mays]|uniref:Uncharacterized protein n=1 Tax=Zea mays TaxID=4577 RepID=A0A1D6FN35_MAIZE|nr:hypothetical protein ZEAMMB73_Zm00001d009920 [Zea mays]
MADSGRQNEECAVDCKTAMTVLCVIKVQKLQITCFCLVFTAAKHGVMCSDVRDRNHHVFEAVSTNPATLFEFIVIEGNTWIAAGLNALSILLLAELRRC